MQAVEELRRKKVVIIDYQLSNLFSVEQACRALGIIAVISSGIPDIITAEALILPGVGAFMEAMKNLNKLDLVSPVKDMVARNTPLFGVCLGQQLLFTESEEFGSGKGLNILPGYIKKFQGGTNGKRVRVPQIAWNKIRSADRSWDNTPLKELKDNDFMYFVHSYYAVPSEKSCVLSMTDYEGTEYCSSVLKNHIFATQFHPEKSSEKGLSVYRNWAKLNHLI